jgi:hypothetical protein
MTIATIRPRIRSRWLGIFGLFLFFVALRWNNYDAPLTRDEGGFAYSAQLLVEGLMPYEHAFEQKPPLVIYSYALSNLLLPQFFWSARLLAYLFVALATALLGYIVQLEFGKGYALPAMWLMTPMVLLPGIDQFWASVEMFMLFPMLATMAIYCYSRQHGHEPKHWFLAAFFAVTTLLYKYTALPVLAFTFAVWFVEMFQKVADRNFIWRCLAFAAAGTVAAVVVEIGYFLAHDGGKQFWECTVLFNRSYVASGIFGPDKLLSQFKYFWENWWILFLVPWVGLLLKNRRVWFWLGIFGCAIIATGMSGYGQYYVVLMPFWALLCALGIRALASRLNEVPKTLPWCGSLLATVVVLLIIQPDVTWLLCTRERFAEVKMNGYPFIESQLMAARVARLSSPDDFVFVAGSEPQILCYAHRFSPTRFVTVYPLMVPGPLARQCQQEVIGDLLKHPPALIVFVITSNSWTRHDTTPLDFFIFLNDFLKQNYELTGGYVRDNQKSRWSDLRANREFTNASLVLYARKSPVLTNPPVTH